MTQQMLTLTTGNQTPLIGSSTGGALIAGLVAGTPTALAMESGGRVAVAPIAGQAGVQGGAGAVNALTQRVVLATDDLVAGCVTSNRLAVNLVSGQAGVAAGFGVVDATVLRQVRSTQQTYMVGINGVAGAIATTTAFLEVLGSASTVVRVIEVALQPSATTTIIFRKNSAAYTGGVDTDPTMVPMDSNNSAATANVKLYTTDPTAGGTLVGVCTALSLAADAMFVWRPGDDVDGQKGVLRGAAQAFAVLSSVAVTWYGHVIFTESAT